MKDFLILICVAMISFIVGVGWCVSSYRDTTNDDCEKLGMFRHGDVVYQCIRVKSDE